MHGPTLLLHTRRGRFAKNAKGRWGSPVEGCLVALARIEKTLQIWQNAFFWILGPEVVVSLDIFNMSVYFAVRH